MVFERKIVVGLEDIRAVSFQCATCEYRVTMSPDEVREVPRACQNGHKWTIGEESALVKTPLLLFTDSLGKLRTLLGQKVLGYRVLFEFDEPKTDK